MTVAVPLEWVRVAALTLLALVLLGGVLRYEQHVVHRSAIAVLVGSMIGLAVSVALQEVWGSGAAAEGFQALVAGGLLVGIWLFAAEFVTGPETETPDPVPPDLTPDSNGGGFEDAERE
jgi:Na+-translocating ferredoxin:NAD+ oxidoreductase RnfD subunit